MKRVSDTSIARKYILENKDKLTHKEMVNYLSLTTNLKKSSIRTLITKVVNLKSDMYQVPTGKHSVAARQYILENKDKLDKEKIIKHISENTMLNEFSAEILYNSINNEMHFESKEKEEEVIYKGKVRDKFRFDDSKLWRNI